MSKARVTMSLYMTFFFLDGVPKARSILKCGPASDDGPSSCSFIFSLCVSTSLYWLSMFTMNWVVVRLELDLSVLLSEMLNEYFVFQLGCSTGHHDLIGLHTVVISLPGSAKDALLLSLAIGWVLDDNFVPN